ncbi:MAG: hydrogenase 3 maturation endopeptidase HyCI [Candidatus Natronoplasma sp.]
MPDKLLLGVGNDIRGDDAVGELVVREFDSDEWDMIDCGSVPENHITLIEEDQYDLVVIVDAAKMNLEPGAIRIVPREHLGVFTMSTHALPLSTVMDFLGRKVKQVYLIGIQPKDMSLKEGMTTELQEAKERMIELLTSDKWKNIPKLEEKQ